jgi:hypothetical protein
MFCKNLELDQFPLQAFQASYKIEFKLSSDKAEWEGKSGVRPNV